jgi:hypothetical protein
MGSGAPVLPRGEELPLWAGQDNGNGIGVAKEETTATVGMAPAKATGMAPAEE